jgi:hypothetical protein
MSFYDFDEYERLVPSGIDATAHLIVLLGGEAGLRCGDRALGVHSSGEILETGVVSEGKSNC